MDKTGSDKKKHRFPIWAIVIICVAAAVAAVLGIGYAYVHSHAWEGSTGWRQQTALAPEEEYFETGETFEEEAGRNGTAGGCSVGCGCRRVQLRRA